MKKLFILLSFVLALHIAFGQIDTELLRRPLKDTSGLQLNMDAVYNRPFIRPGKLPVALGGYVEANHQ